MKDEISVRFATIDDIDFLLPLVYIAQETLRQKIEVDEFIVAEANGQRVGFLELDYLWSLVPYIAMIMVLEEHRKQGVGRKLLEFAENYLVKRAHKLIYSSSQENEPAPQEWHRHVGFEVCGKIDGINDGVAEIFFCKKI